MCEDNVLDNYNYNDAVFSSLSPKGTAFLSHLGLFWEPDVFCSVWI